MMELDVQLGEIIESTAGALLAREAIPCEPPARVATQVVGEVMIGGGWTGRVVVACDRQLARTFAAAMFDRGAEQITDGEVEDALSELTNIVGGNFKSLVPTTEHCTLSLPHVLDHSPAGPWLLDRWFDVEGSRLHVCVAREESR